MGRPEEEVNSLTKQVGGDHYKKMKIQPIEYISANKMLFEDGNIIKYVSRFRNSGKAIKDLEKIIHYAEILIDLELEDQKNENN
tara:strand:- start:546 stop:797 length:252 start_codon:yes stop_codon:yes gene_type:complete